jgi:hypothetical protein
MSFRSHEPIEDETGTVCAHCCEPWPCPTRKVVVEVAEHIKPKTPEPVCCDTCYKRWRDRNDIAEELIDGE